MSNYKYEIEETATGFSAYVPDLPGCVAGAETRERVEQLIVEAIALHLEEMRPTVVSSVTVFSGAETFAAGNWSASYRFAALDRPILATVSENVRLLTHR